MNDALFEKGKLLIQEELLRKPDTGLYWVFLDELRAEDARPCWELVENQGTSLGVTLNEFWTNILIFTDGKLQLHGQAPIQCASVEEAKEMGMTTYLLTKEGG